jgi:hypothetical protein
VNDFGTDFEDVASWAAAAHPARSRLRRVAGPRPGITPLGPSRQDVRLAFGLVGASAVLLAGLLVWGAAERRGQDDEPGLPQVYEVPSDYGPETSPSWPPVTVDAGFPVYEDDPRWDCQEDGNEVCGEETDEHSEGPR